MDFDNQLDIIFPDVASNTIIIGGTGSLQLPAGTSGQRPGSDLSVGMLRWVTDVNSGSLEIYTGVTNTWRSLQFQSTNLDNFSAMSTSGFVNRNGTTYTARSLTAPSEGITISNNDGTAGNPTFSLANDLSAVEGLSTVGIVVRTAADTWATRSMTVGSGLSLTNPAGIAGNLELSLDFVQVSQGGTGAANDTGARNNLLTPNRALFTDGADQSIRALDDRACANPTQDVGYGSGARFRFSSMTDNSVSPWADVIDLSTYQDGSGGGFNSLYFNKTDLGQIVHKFAAAAATTWSQKTLEYKEDRPRAITILDPTATEKIIWFHTPVAIALSEIRSVVMGTNPSVTFSIRYGTDISTAGTEVVTGGITCANTSTGVSTTSFTNATIPVGYVWLTTSAASGTITQINVNLR